MGINYGLVGTGQIAENKHLKGYSQTGNVKISALCYNRNRERAERLAEKYNVPAVYSDYSEMLRKEKLDLISICTPNSLHHDQILEAIRAGVNIHCEKPLALNIDEVLSIKEALETSDAKLVVGMNNRFTNEAVFLKKYIDSGALGNIYLMKCGWRRRRFIPGKGGWFTDSRLSGGGPLIDLGVHLIDLLMYLTNKWEPVSAGCSTYNHLINQTSMNDRLYGDGGEGRCDVEDSAVGMLRFSDSSSMFFEFSWAANIADEGRYLEILGDRGGVYFDWEKLRIITTIEDTVVEIHPDTNYPKEAACEFETAVKVISGAENIDYPNIDEALISMRIIENAYASARVKEEVKISYDL